MVLSFLEVYLPIWDGYIAVDTILGILSYIPKQDFQGMPILQQALQQQLTDLAVYQTYFAYAERALTSQGPETLGKLLSFYSGLLQHWSQQHMQKVAPPTGSDIQETALPTSSDIQGVALPTGSAWSPTDRLDLENLTTHVFTLSTSLLLSLSTPADSPLTSSIITFYESISLRAASGTGPIILPPRHLSYLLAQGSSLANLSRICGLYANFKAAFDAHAKRARIADYFRAEVTNGFNDCLRHLHNLLWGSQKLPLARTSFALFLDPALQDPLSAYLESIDLGYAPKDAFGLTHNALLASPAGAAWREFENQKIITERLDKRTVALHKGPVTLQSLDVLKSQGGVDVALMEYKKYVLQWLAGRGCDGPRRLMYATNAKLRQ